MNLGFIRIIRAIRGKNVLRLEKPLTANDADWRG
jgi:hypothetical protein